MKAIPHMSAREFSRSLRALARDRQDQSWPAFRKRFRALLNRISDAEQFQALWRFCLNIGGRQKLGRLVLVAWDQMMSLKLLIQVEIRKPFCASFDWLRRHTQEYVAIYKQCAPGASVALRIRQLFVAAGCELPA